MSIHEANIAIERATSLVTLLIGRNDDTEGKDIDNTFFDINRNLYDAEKYLNEPAEKQEQHTDAAAEINIDLAEAVDTAMLNINKICIVGSRYSDAVFSDDDSEHCLMFRTLVDFAYAARCRLKTAKDQLLK
ncbi:hypothetical protein MP659_002654 [Salmonella enterica]|uniref:Uncharacterized protein n=1 Tax=Salmonella enterica TaxID=28901 RepID=A0A759WBQ6_SALER|nr:hypothetical protein [Salmonella enterica]EIM5531726.1 hypothetical protein [Salmonella enterica subsp. enterica]EIE1692850.1 hypothetical protein [Salmonella enterica]EIW3445122.1 hypothetical protein [Salmonella enterica]EIZ5130065.1 hypothetical protein [Salmonella enterica]